MSELVASKRGCAVPLPASTSRSMKGNPGHRKLTVEGAYLGSKSKLMSTSGQSKPAARKKA